MGGLGSGRHMGPGRATVESVPSISIIELYRAGKISKDAEAAYLGPEGGPAPVLAQIAWLPCPFGGARPLWRCPCCNRRVEWLYWRRDQLACRHCWNLCYESQLEGPNMRAKRRMWACWARLDAEEADRNGKPKWMRWRTYERLLEETREAETEAFAPLLRSAWMRRWYGDQ